MKKVHKNQRAQNGAKIAKCSDDSHHHQHASPHRSRSPQAHAHLRLTLSVTHDSTHTPRNSSEDSRGPRTQTEVLDRSRHRHISVLPLSRAKLQPLSRYRADAQQPPSEQASVRKVVCRRWRSRQLQGEALHRPLQRARPPHQLLPLLQERVRRVGGGNGCASVIASKHRSSGDVGERPRGGRWPCRGCCSCCGVSAWHGLSGRCMCSACLLQLGAKVNYLARWRSKSKR